MGIPTIPKRIGRVTANDVNSPLGCSGEGHPDASKDGLGYLIWWHKRRLEQARAGLIAIPWEDLSILENEVRIAESFKKSALLGYLPEYKAKQLESIALRLECSQRT